MTTIHVLTRTVLLLALLAGTARAQLYVESTDTNSPTDLSIGEYNTDGTPVQAQLIEPSQGGNLTVQNDDLFISDSYVNETTGNPDFLLQEYDSSGNSLGSASIPNLNAYNIAEVGSDVYLGTYYNATDGSVHQTIVGEYTNSGQALSPGLITINDTNGSAPTSLAVAGNDIFVSYRDDDTSQNYIGEYDLSGNAVNSKLIALGGAAYSMTVSAGNLYFETDNGNDTYNIQEASVSTGSLVNSNLATVQGSGEIAISGDSMYVSATNDTTDAAKVLLYSATTGSLENPSLIGGLQGSVGIVIGNTAAPVTPTTTTSTLTGGQSYTNVAPVTSTGGLNTTTSLVGGVSGSSTETVTLSTTTLADQFKSLASDVVSVSGNAGNVFAVQLTFDLNAANEIGGADAVRLLWLNPATGKWTNAINGNTDVNGHGNVTNPSFLDFDGSFQQFELQYSITDADLADYLGAYGVDTVNDTVWAVIDHNSDFTAANGDSPPLAIVTPEPATWALLVGGLGLLAFWRRQPRRS